MIAGKAFEKGAGNVETTGRCLLAQNVRNGNGGCSGEECVQQTKQREETYLQDLAERKIGLQNPELKLFLDGVDFIDVLLRLP